MTTMPEEVWKEYEDNALTHSAAHYLMTIKELLELQGYARVTDIAKRLNITRGSCSISLKALKKRGYVVEDENRFLRLSPEGMRLAEMVERNDELLEKFFKNVLGVDPDQAEVDACKIEHLLSIESSIRLESFIRTWESMGDVVGVFNQERRKHEVQCSSDAGSCEVCGQFCLRERQPFGPAKADLH